MSSEMLLFLDQLRNNMGILFAFFIFCYFSYAKREHFLARLIIGALFLTLLSAIWVPAYELMQEHYETYIWKGFLLYILDYLVSILVVASCFRIGFRQLIFRCLAGSAANVIPNIALRYILVETLFPALPDRYPLIYITSIIIIYGVNYSIIYFFIIRNMGKESALSLDHMKGIGIIGVILFLVFNVSTAISQSIIEGIMIPLTLNEQDNTDLQIICGYLIIVLLVYAALVLLLVYFVYGKLLIQQEQLVLNQITQDRALQYETSRENIEIINRRAHDLKHMLGALEQVDDTERNKLIQEIRGAIASYDMIYATGNEVLDTILTEKNTICVNRGIKLSVLSDVKGLEKISVIDLYSLLGNALDNAIECVSNLTEDNKKVISFRAENHGQMIHFMIENYYEGKIEMKDGFPITQKEDKQNHGFGVRSMKMIALNYNGSIKISFEEQRFLLQILLVP